MAWFALAAVEQMDLSAFYAAYRDDGHGRPAHDPATMVALLLYAYAKGQRSARVIERECLEDIAYRVIAANQRPDHTTIARFRQRHERALGELFGEVLGLCQAAACDDRRQMLDELTPGAEAALRNLCAEGANTAEGIQRRIYSLQQITIAEIRKGLSELERVGLATEVLDGWELTDVGREHCPER